MLKLFCKLTLTEEMLGTASANPEVYEEFIAKRLGDAAEEKGITPAQVDEAKAEEMASLPTVAEALEKGTTCFHRDTDGTPILYDYAFKGAFKGACQALSRTAEKDADGKKGKSEYLSSGLKAYRKEIDQLVFVFQAGKLGCRKVRAILPDGGKIEYKTRPLRAQTAQGERVSLARSETLPAGTRFEFEIHLLRTALRPLIEEWLNYGLYMGMGQWRSAGWGRYTFELSEIE